jgi:dienelactone hydrolase
MLKTLIEALILKLSEALQPRGGEETAMRTIVHPGAREVRVGGRKLAGTLRVPDDAFALVVFAHGSGSSRTSPRNVMVAEALNQAGLATLLFDLLEPREEAADSRAKVFDIPLLADRIVDAVCWVDEHPALRQLPVGLFGASTGAAAALMAAAKMPRIGAIVSRGGRPDLASAVLDAVTAPTLLIVGGRDGGVVQLNREAFAGLTCMKALDIIPGATHLFPEPGAMGSVVILATAWFSRHLRNREDRHAAPI